MKFIFGILFLLPITYSQSDSSKWVWNDSRRNDNVRLTTGDKRYNGELVTFAKPIFQANSNYNNNNNNDRRYVSSNYRYEVTETPYPGDYSTYRPRPPEQYRPDSAINRPINPYRPPPDYVRPTNSLDNYRPTNRPYENEYRPLGNGYRPPNGDYSSHGLRPGVGTNGKPILTGPTPSWVEEGQEKYRDYDICKCVHSFNCNTPGIKFGTCDVDKQYCCYKSKQNENSVGKPTTSVYQRPRPVLAGPGGPVDNNPGRPYQNKYPSGRPYRPEVEKTIDTEREFNEAYKKGLASAIQEVYQRPSYYDRDPQNYRDYKEYYQPDRDYYRPVDNYKSSHPSKYGLYYPTVGGYGRSSNSTISAISDSKN